LVFFVTSEFVGECNQGLTVSLLVNATKD